MLKSIFFPEPMHKTKKRLSKYKKDRQRIRQIRECKEQLKLAYELLCEEEIRMMRNIYSLEDVLLKKGGK